MLTSFFQDSLKDIVIKSRSSSSKKDFMKELKNSIQLELSSTDKIIKSKAISKLFFLIMNFSSTDFAIINTLEVITTCGTIGKRYGYSILPLQIKENSEFLQLIPNVIFKEISNCENMTHLSLCLSCIGSLIFIRSSHEKHPAVFDMRSLYEKIEKLLNINDFTIRKKVIVVLTRIVLYLNQNESIHEDLIQSLILSFGKILESSNTLSQGLIISIISSIEILCWSCEGNKISKNGNLYKGNDSSTKLIFLPLWNFFKSTTINWVIIKSLHIFQFLSITSIPKLFKSKEIINHLGQMLKKQLSKSVEVEIIKILLVNLDILLFTDLYVKCEESLRLFFKYNDSNLIIITIKIIKSMIINGRFINESLLEDLFVLLNEYNIQERIYEEIIDVLCMIVDLNFQQERFKFIYQKIFFVEKIYGSNVESINSRRVISIRRYILNRFLSLIQKVEFDKILYEWIIDKCILHLKLLERIDNDEASESNDYALDNKLLLVIYDFLYKIENFTEGYNVIQSLYDLIKSNFLNDKKKDSINDTNKSMTENESPIDKDEEDENIVNIKIKKITTDEYAAIKSIGNKAKSNISFHPHDLSTLEFQSNKKISSLSNLNTILLIISSFQTIDHIINNICIIKSILIEVRDVFSLSVFILKIIFQLNNKGKSSIIMSLLKDYKDMFERIDNEESLRMTFTYFSILFDKIQEKYDEIKEKSDNSEVYNDYISYIWSIYQKYEKDMYKSKDLNDEERLVEGKRIISMNKLKEMNVVINQKELEIVK